MHMRAHNPSLAPQGSPADVGEHRPTVESIASHQHSVFTRRQAVEAAGLSDRTLHHRVAAGRYRRRLPGVFSIEGVPLTRESSLMAALLYAGGEAALARQTALEIHGLWTPDRRGAIHLLVKTRCFDPVPGLIVHRTSRLRPVDRGRVGAFDTTTVARSICDVANDLGPTRLRRLVDEAVRRGLTSPDQLQASASWLGRFRGKRMLMPILDELSPLLSSTRSDLEAEFLAVTTAAGIPPTAMNHPVTDARGHQRFVDAVYMPPNLPVELDARTTHGSQLAWHDDLRRENDIALTREWLPFLRFSRYDVFHRPDLVVATVRHALDLHAIE